MPPTSRTACCTAAPGLNHYYWMPFFNASLFTECTGCFSCGPQCQWGCQITWNTWRQLRGEACSIKGGVFLPDDGLKQGSPKWLILTPLGSINAHRLNYYYLIIVYMPRGWVFQWALYCKGDLWLPLLEKIKVGKNVSGGIPSSTCPSCMGLHNPSQILFRIFVNQQ